MCFYPLRHVHSVSRCLLGCGMWLWQVAVASGCGMAVASVGSVSDGFACEESAGGADGGDGCRAVIVVPLRCARRLTYPSKTEQELHPLVGLDLPKTASMQNNLLAVIRTPQRVDTMPYLNKGQ